MATPDYPEQRYVVTSLFRYIIAGILFVVLIAAFAWFFFFRNANTGDKVATDNGGSSQKITDNTDKSGSSGSTSNNTPSGSESTSGSTSGSGATSTDTKKADTTTGSNSTATTDTNTASDQSTSNTTATKPNATSTQSPSSEELANTGPGETLALFMAVTVVAGLLHRYYLGRQNS
jgi:cytoskeletal protein RodZ